MKKYQFKLPILENVKTVEMTVVAHELSLKFTYNDPLDATIPNEFMYDQDKKRYYAILGAPWMSEGRIKQRIGEESFHKLFEIYLQRKEA